MKFIFKIDTLNKSYYNPSYGGVKMEHRFKQFFKTEQEKDEFLEKAVNPEVFVNMVGNPTQVLYRMAAIQSNLPHAMYATHPFCVAYDGVTKRKTPVNLQSMEAKK